MTPVYESTDRIEVVTRYRPRDMNVRLFSTVNQIPVSLVISGVEHHAIVQFELCGFDRRFSAFQVSGGCHHIADAFAYSSGDHARIVQLSEADPKVNIFRDQIEELIRDEKIDPNPRLSFKEPRKEFKEGPLTQNDRHRHPQHAFWCLLSQSQDSLGFFQKG